MALTIVQAGMGGTGSTTASSTGTGAAVLATQPSFPSTIGVGGATAAASGSGITFPATQSASTDANTLDDYEEGSWTPNLGGNTTYDFQVGRYVKVGRMVYIEFYLAINSIGTGSPSQVYGLPFSSNNDSSLGGLSVAYWTTINTALVFIGGYKNSNDASLILIGTTAAATAATNAPSVFKNGTGFYASMVYRSAS